MQLNEEFLVKAVPGIKIECQPIPALATFQIDSRKVIAQDIFVALSGARVNGHDFVQQAVEHGAGGLMIEETQRDCLKKINSKHLKKLCILVDRKSVV